MTDRQPDNSPIILSDSVAGSLTVSSSDLTSGTTEGSAVIPNSLNVNGMLADMTDSQPSAPPGQNCPPSDSKSTVTHNHSLSGGRNETSVTEKTGANGSTGNGRSSNRSHSRHSSSSRSSGKKHSRYSDHRHKASKSSPLPSESRSRKQDSQMGSPVTESNHKSTGRHKVVSSTTAEKRTRIVLHVYEEVVQHGTVVDSKVKQTEFITSGGSVPWPPIGPAAVGLDDNSETFALLQNRDIVETLSNSVAKLPAVTEKSRSSGKAVKQESGVKRNSHKSASETSASKKVRNEGKGLQSLDNEEDHRIEMASTLLSLQTESPVKKIERQDNFHEVVFLPLKQGSSCLAKWTDKNYYAGTLSSNLGDGRWHVLFDDGGKKAVNESDIICAPHLAIGQVVMASFSDGSLCTKGMVKQPFYEKNRLFYHVEYNDGSKNYTEKFSRRDIFLTADLAAALLNKQSKKSELSARFADVDLNNIIPKRSRTTAQSKPLDGSTDDSEPESVSSSVKSLPKSRKLFTPTKTLAIISSNSSNNHASATSRPLAKSPIPETKPDPPHTDGDTSPRDEIANAITNNAPPEAVKQLPPAASQSQNPPDLLGPVPDEGSILFKGITFLLTTADAGNTNANDATDSGRSSALFDIPHLIKQIESGGGVVHQTLETAQESAAGVGNKIILLAYTYLRTVKYMQCLAAGIPCVMHTWLIECCRKNQLLDIDGYRLPSGYSIISNSLITDRTVFAKSSTLFNGVRFMLVSKNPRHAESWTSVLTAAKAVVVEDFPSSSGKASNAVDVIISDLTCPPIVTKKAQQMKIPIVSSEYVVQCLINGRRLSCEAHEKFGISHK